MLRRGGFIFLKNSSKSISEFFSIAAIAIWARLLVAFVSIRVTSATVMIGSTTNTPKSAIMSIILIFLCFIGYTYIFFELAHIYNE